jgi:CubicO group peptidase (beta-lactamase class C family)
MIKRLLFLNIILVTSITCFSQSRQDTIAMIEKAMDRYQTQNPGYQLSIKKKGEIIFSKAYGMADLERNIPLTLTSIIEAGSVSKQFTAAAILLLEQQGKLSLKDDIRKYIPEVPNYGTVITLEQMMHHTSGLRDWGSIAKLTGWERTTKTYTNNDALEIIAAQKELNNVPGAEFIYSNSNYNLLAIVVLRVSGKSLAEFTKQYIFTPANMSHTEWRDNHKRIVKDRAIAYSITKNGYETEMPNEDVYGNGGLLTTTEDLLKWNDYYLSGKLGTPSLFSKQTKTEAFNNGKMGKYGAGLFISKYRGTNSIEHDGATAGFRSDLVLFPDQNLSISFLSNTSQFDNESSSIIDTLKNIFIAKKEEAQGTTKKETTVHITESVLNSYAGWYKSDRSGTGIKIHVKDKNLFFGNDLLTPVSENKFKITDTDEVVEMNDSKGLILSIPTDNYHYTKVEANNHVNENLSIYEGKYFSKETNSTISIYLKDGKLWFHLKPDADYQLEPTYKDAFTVTDFNGNLYFIKNKKNEITLMKISVSRARNVAFEKLK